MEKDNVLPEFEFIDDLDNMIDVPAPEPDDKPIEEPEAEVEVVASEPEPQKEPEKQEEPTDGSTPKGEPHLVAAYQYYVDQGIFEKADEGTEVTIDMIEENLSKAMEKKAEESLDAFIDPLPEFGKALIQLALEKRNALTIDDIQSIIKEVDPVTLSVDDMQDENKAVAYMVDKYKKDGIAEEDAEDMANVLKDKGTIAQTASKFLAKELEEKNKKFKNVAEQAKERRVKEKEKQVEFQKSFSQALEGTGWRKDQKEKIVDSFMSKEFSSKLSAALYQDPNALIQLIDFMSYYDQEKKKFNMEAYKKEAFSPSVTKVVKNVRESLWNQAAESTVQKDRMNKSYEFID